MAVKAIPIQELQQELRLSFVLIAPAHAVACWFADQIPATP
nr:hypothetical protein [uncultured Achromobacter sp.]